MKLLPPFAELGEVTPVQPPPDEIGTGPDATPLEVMLAIMNNPALPLHTRHRAARDAAPYVHAKRSTVTNVNIGLANAIEARARLAPQTVKVIEASRER